MQIELLISYSKINEIADTIYWYSHIYRQRQCIYIHVFQSKNHFWCEHGSETYRPFRILWPTDRRQTDRSSHREVSLAAIKNHIWQDFQSALEKLLIAHCVPDTLNSSCVLLPQVLEVLVGGLVVGVAHLDGAGVEELWRQVLHLAKVLYL